MKIVVTLCVCAAFLVSGACGGEEAADKPADGGTTSTSEFETVTIAIEGMT